MLGLLEPMIPQRVVARRYSSRFDAARLLPVQGTGTTRTGKVWRFVVPFWHSWVVEFGSLVSKKSPGPRADSYHRVNVLCEIQDPSQRQRQQFYRSIVVSSRSLPPWCTYITTCQLFCTTSRTSRDSQVTSTLCFHTSSTCLPPSGASVDEINCLHNELMGRCVELHRWEHSMHKNGGMGVGSFTLVAGIASAAPLCFGGVPPHVISPLHLTAYTEEAMEVYSCHKTALDPFIKDCISNYPHHGFCRVRNSYAKARCCNQSRIFTSQTHLNDST